MLKRIYLGLRATLSIALGAFFAASAAAAASLPPRSVDDIVTLLRSSPPASDIASARQLLDGPEPTATSGRQAAEAWRARAIAAERIGLTNRYLDAYRKAWEASGKSVEMTNAMLSVEYTAAETHAGNILNAIRVQEDIVAHSPLAGRRLGANAFLTELAARHGDLRDAGRFLRAAEGDYSTLQRSPHWSIWGEAWEASMARAQASIALAQGKYGDAEKHFRKSVDHRERDLERNQSRLASGGDTFSQPIAIGHLLIAKRGLAETLLLQGRLAEAELAYRENVTRGVAAFGTTSPLMQLHLEGLSQVLLEQGRPADAGKVAAATLEILEKQGTAPESRMLTSARLRLAASHVALGQWPEARRQYDAVATILGRDEQLQRRLGRGDKDWALTLVRTGQADAAIRMMEQVLASEAQRFLDSDLPVAEARGFLAVALAAGGQSGRALEEFRKAVPVLLFSQQDVADEGQMAATRRRVVILEAYLDLLAKIHREGKAPADLDPVAEAFRIADVAKGSSVQRALIVMSARAAVRDPGLATLARDEQDLSHRIAALSETLSRLASAPTDQRLDKIINDIRRDIPNLKLQRQTLREQISRTYPDYANLVAPRALTPDEIRPYLGEDEALLTIYSGETRSYVWSFSRQGAVAFSTVEMPASALNERVTRLRAQLDPGAAFGFDLDFSFSTTHELYQRVIAPVRPGIGKARQLLVVSHGPLAQLPLAILTTQPFSPARSAVPFESMAKAPWLIREFALTQLPSANTLAALRRSKTVQTASRSPFMGYGDPVFSRRSVPSIKAQMRGIALRNTVTTRTSSEATLGDLAPLPDTAPEIREIATALGADPATATKLGENATETGIKSADLSAFRVIAFATHGLTPGDINGLTQPALALSNPEVTGETDADGLLTMEEILGLRLNADWVILSACNTATGDGQSGESLSGLGRAFFYAGSHALLATHWPVETVSARLITTDIFRRQAAQPDLERSQALRAAMLALLDSSAKDQKSGKPTFSYAHPLFWAPFALIGDGGR